MKKNAIILMSFLLFLYSSCSENEDVNIIPEEEEINPMDPFIPFEKPNIKYDLRLGYGYDFTGPYLNDRSVREEIIDVSKWYEEDTDIVTLDIGNRSSGYYYLGSSASKYAYNMTTGTNIYTFTNSIPNGISAYSGTILDNLTLYSDDLEEYSYGSYHVFFKTISYKFMWWYKKESLVNYLTESFVNDLNLLSAEQLIEKYGTHIISDHETGGRLDFILKSKIDKNNNVNDVLHAGLSYVVNQKLNNQVLGTLDIKEENIKANKVPVFFIESHGGDNSIIPNGTYNLQKEYPKPLDIKKWMTSFDETNAALIDLNLNDLIPIYDIIKDEQKRAEIKSAVEKYIETRQLHLK